jgi:hypothetical protein
MKAFIINFNRLTYLRDMVTWCLEHNLEPVIVDNASDYAPLLEYYHSKPCQIIQMPHNYGHTVMWQGLIKLPKGRFIITDPDLDMSGVPDDFLKMMNLGLDCYPWAAKCGLSLEIDDIPEGLEKQAIYGIESNYWMHPLDPLFFKADVDTTFALYRETTREHTHVAVRCNRPYTARHYSWYYQDFEDIPKDEQNYYRTANASASGKNRLMK